MCRRIHSLIHVLGRRATIPMTRRICFPIRIGKSLSNVMRSRAETCAEVDGELCALSATVHE